jgi:hypothetical protein
VAKVDNAAPAGAKEDGVVQPALAVVERAPTEKLAVGKMHERKIPTCFEKRNVLDPHDPTFEIVSQEHKMITIKYSGNLSSLSSAGVSIGRSRIPMLFICEWVNDAAAWKRRCPGKSRPVCFQQHCAGKRGWIRVPHLAVEERDVEL